MRSFSDETVTFKSNISWESYMLLPTSREFEAIEMSYQNDQNVYLLFFDIFDIVYYNLVRKSL